MKTFTALAFFVVCFGQAHAQGIREEVQRPGTTNQSKAIELNVPLHPKTQSKLFQREVTYRGFLIDVARTTNRIRLLNLRQPADPKRDAGNLSRDPVTDRAMGFTLLSVGF